MAADTTNIGAMPPSISVVAGPSASDQPVNYLSLSFSASTDLVAGVAGKKIRVLEIELIQDTAAESIKFQSTGATSTDLTGPMKLGSGGAPLISDWAPCGHFETKSGEKLNVVKSSNVSNIQGWLVYQLVDGTVD